MLRARIQSSLVLYNMRPKLLTRSSSSQKFAPSLPRLPVPDLRKTLDRYLASLEPFFLEDELHGGMSYSSAYSLRAKWADQFESGIGKVLQDRLLALDRASPHNWLDDNFWIDKAYLEWRAPLLINSNWWLAFKDDDLIPKSALAGETNNNRAGTTFWQIRRAAWLVHRMLKFKEQLDTQELHPETTRTGIWLRESTSKMFNIARIPEPYCDVLSLVSPDSPHSRCLLVMVHNWCYAVDVYYPSDSPDDFPKLMSPGEIEKALRAVILDVESRLEKGEVAFPVGVLSADDRDNWAENLNHLLSLSETNRRSYHAMLHCVMGLSLEHTTYHISPSQIHSAPSSPAIPKIDPDQLRLDAHLHTIRSTPLNVSNRFFDKPFTLIVDPSTHTGATGEHSPCDALVPSIVAEYGIIEGVDVDAFKRDHVTPTSLSEADISFTVAPSSHRTDDEGWERLDWVVDDKAIKESKAAELRAVKIIDDSDDSVLWFDVYGTDWIKRVVQLSPDAYIQMALQLAWYKTRGEFTATYETVLTRMFKRGRTETVRTFSRDSRDWVLSMVDNGASNVIRLRALRQAIQTHARLTREAATGRGIDRHLLGLRLLLRPLNGEVAALFEDELFERSATWKLSTSGLSAGHLFKGTGFGAMYEDGYGINYLAAPEMIKFGIESKFSSSKTSTTSLKKAIEESLLEMHAICSVSDHPNFVDNTSHL